AHDGPMRSVQRISLVIQDIVEELPDTPTAPGNQTKLSEREKRERPSCGSYSSIGRSNWKSEEVRARRAEKRDEVAAFPESRGSRPDAGRQQWFSILHEGDSMAQEGARPNWC